MQQVFHHQAACEAGGAVDDEVKGFGHGDGFKKYGCDAWSEGRRLECTGFAGIVWAAWLPGCRVGALPTVRHLLGA